jgi:hypothetical protein
MVVDVFSRPCRVISLESRCTSQRIEAINGHARLASVRRTSSAASALKMAQRDDFVWAKKGLQFGRAASGQGSNARTGALSENPGSIPCAVPSTAPTGPETATSRPTTHSTAVPGAFLLSSLRANQPRNLASGWMCGRLVGALRVNLISIVVSASQALRRSRKSSLPDTVEQLLS